MDPNPFDDPDHRVPAHGPDEPTLIVGRHASLTLGTDSLVVLDEAIPHDRRRFASLCGLIPSQRSLPTRSIPFYNILWASVNEFDLTIYHAHPVSRSVVRPTCIAYPIIKSDRARVSAWVDQLLDRAYGASQRKKRIKVLINPFGGKGSAQKWFLRDIEPIFAAAHCHVDVERTSYSGHAVEIAEKLDADAYDVIASCSGDGLPHEVFNGLGKRPDAARALKKLAVVQLPCGTGNAMSLNLNGTNSCSMAALAVVKGFKMPMDLVSVTQGDCRTLSFLSQAFGMVAETDLGTDHLRWMGEARFTYGFLVRVLGKTVYPCEVAYMAVQEDDKAGIRQHYRDHVNSLDIPRKSSLPDEQLAHDDDDEDAAATASTSSTTHPGLPPLRYGTINSPLPPPETGWTQLTKMPHVGNFYAGNMPYMAPDANFFAAALPSDGCLDLAIIAGDCSRLAALRVLLAVSNGTLFDMPAVHYRKVTAFRIVPHARDTVPTRFCRIRRSTRALLRFPPAAASPTHEGYISIDGEKVPFEPFQVEVHRGLGTVLSRTGRVYEAPPLVGS